MDSLYIYGTGEHSRKIFQCARLLGMNVLGFIDCQRSSSDQQIQGVPLFLFDEINDIAEKAVFIAIGNPRAREDISQQFLEKKWQIVNLIHPQAYVAGDVKLGSGLYIGAMAVVETGTVLQDGVIVDIGAIIDHDCFVGKFNHVRPGTILHSKTKIN